MEFHYFLILQIAKGGPYDYFQYAKGGPYDSCKIIHQEHPIFLDFHQNVKGGPYGNSEFLRVGPQDYLIN